MVSNRSLRVQLPSGWRAKVSIRPLPSCRTSPVGSPGVVPQAGKSSQSKEAMGGATPQPSLGLGGGGGTITANRKARQADGVSSILITANDFASAWALDERNLPLFPVVPGGERQREMAFRTGINIAMYALTGNYKSDQVHVPALLERLGQ